MPKSKYDLRRIRKIYPVRRRTPLIIDTSGDAEAFKVEFTPSDGLSKNYVLQQSYSSAPVVVISVENDNVNVYVSTISGSSSAGWTITITTSHAFTGTVHGLANEVSS